MRRKASKTCFQKQFLFPFAEPPYLAEVARRTRTAGARLRKGRYFESQGGALVIRNEAEHIVAVESQILDALKSGRVPLTIARAALWEALNICDDQMAAASLEHVENPTVGWDGGKKGR